jgi:hypothetical protein
MRKCPQCGYLAFGDSETCKHCGAVLPLATAAPPFPTPALMAVPPVPPPMPRAIPPGAAAPPPPTPQDYWTPPAPMTAPAPARSAPRALLAIIVVVSMAVGWVAYDHRRNALPPGTSAFVAGHGVTYSPPDHTFDIQLPETPTVGQRIIPVSTSTARITLAQAQTDDYEIVAASMVLPGPVPAGQVTAVLREVLNASAGANGDKFTTQNDVMHQGVSGIEVRAEVHDGYAARFIVLISGAHIYMLGVHAKQGTDRLYNALLASLIMY